VRQPREARSSDTKLAKPEIVHNSAANPLSLGLVQAMFTTQARASLLISGSCGRW
jgi:hypothetical protein